jgi:hypothetical protein
MRKRWRRGGRPLHRDDTWSLVGHHRQLWSGIGETTGRRYVEHFVNLFFSTTGTDGFPLISTQQLIYRVNSSGPGFDSTIRIRNHTTINANGDTTVTFDQASMDCLAQTP